MRGEREKENSRGSKAGGRKREGHRRLEAGRQAGRQIWKE
jgi:hypothetical protein